MAESERYKESKVPNIYLDNWQGIFDVFVLWVKAGGPNEIVRYEFANTDEAKGFLSGLATALAASCDDMTRFELLDPWEFQFHTTGDTSEDKL